jgi:hypothetical protein
MKIPKDLIARLTSRKFLLAVLAALGATGVALQDGSMTQQELWTVLAPVLSFIGFEGAADVAGRYSGK